MINNNDIKKIVRDYFNPSDYLYKECTISDLIEELEALAKQHNLDKDYDKLKNLIFSFEFDRYETDEEYIDRVFREKRKEEEEERATYERLKKKFEGL